MVKDASLCEGDDEGQSCPRDLRDFVVRKDAIGVADRVSNVLEKLRKGVGPGLLGVRLGH